MIVAKKASWIQFFFALRGSVLSAIWRRVLVTLIIAVAITVVRSRSAHLDFNLTLTPFSLVGVAISIFLGFRNNTSYDRFWEGRKLWGSLVNTSRTLVRKILTLTEASAEDKHSLSESVIGYVHSLRMHLRGDWSYEKLGKLLPPQLVEHLKKSTNVPMMISLHLGQSFRQLRQNDQLDRYYLPALEEELTNLTNIQGGCERIKSTPIPFAYTVLMHRIVGLYCVTLPLGIYDIVGQLTPLVVLIVSYTFYSLDAIGGEIEDPFGIDPNDLPLKYMSEMIESNLREQMGDSFEKVSLPDNGVAQ